ncbi:MAG: trypsin-like peptidase domain-containing protein [Elainellaceae cyanobacterium]
MLKISNDDRKQLREALNSGFRNYTSLKIFVSDNFEDVRLNEIATSRATRDAADDLIEHFEESGNIPDLILALHKERPRNPEVKQLMLRLQGFLHQRFVLDPAFEEKIDYPFELPTAYEDVQLEAFLPRQFSYEADVGKLKRGLQLANAVCKVSFTDCDRTGTGVLVAPDLVLTNYHVLSSQVIEERSQLAEKAKTLIFEFGFVSQEHNSLVSPDTFAVETTEPLVAYSPPHKLDYALLRVESRITDAQYITPIPTLSLLSPLSPRDGLNVLQHPQGNVMQVSLSASGVVQTDVSRGRVWYVNRTQGGSSGSPCFSNDWNLVALHHASMSRGFGSVREGILLPSICAEISEFLSEV